MTDAGELLTAGDILTMKSSNEWMRPKQLFPPQLTDVPYVFNFVLRGRGALLVTGPANEADHKHGEIFVVCGSLGQPCPGVDDANSFFGSERVITSLKSNPQWPNIQSNLRRFT